MSDLFEISFGTSVENSFPNFIYACMGFETELKPSFDVDFSAFLLDEAGKARSEADFIFYQQRSTEDGCVKYVYDDDEWEWDSEDWDAFVVGLNQVAPDVSRIAFAVSILGADELRRTPKIGPGVKL